MTAQEVNSNLYRHFANYEYKLNNTYVFDWESDFFAQSKSGYFIECEVKISRSDYFKDFEKPKHKLFPALQAGKSHFIYRNPHKSWGDQLGISREAYICLDRSRVNTNKPLVERNYGFYRSANKPHMQKQYVVNDWGFNRISIRHTEHMVYAPVSTIRIKKMEDIFCPHQFYFAVPAGLINVEELPKYAGLIVIREEETLYGKSSTVHVLKKAPYLHKRSMDLSRTLLKKYYNLWQYKVPYEVKAAIRSDYTD